MSVLGLQWMLSRRTRISRGFRKRMVRGAHRFLSSTFDGWLVAQQHF